MMEKNLKKYVTYEDICNFDDLIHYLRKPFSRLGSISKDRKYLHHYTTIDGLIGIVKSNTWHFNQAQCMNDKLEYLEGNQTIWDTSYFSSFILEEDETIGLWSMYGTPWDKGIKISIPVSVIESWIHDKSNRLFDVDCKTKKNGEELLRNYSFYAYSVAYLDKDKSNSNGYHPLWCGLQVNSNLISKNSIYPELTGYIKNIAWQYEKEIRIRINFDKQCSSKRVAVGLNNSMIDSMIITPGPKYLGNIEADLKSVLNREFSVKYSLFKDRLYLTSDCSNCLYDH